MWIVHVADLHLSDEITMAKQTKIKKGIYDVIVQNMLAKAQIKIVITGDVIDKGNREHYKKAEKFVRDLLRELKEYDIEVIMCPGNHDIVDREFKAFDEFNFSITHNSDFLFKDKHVAARVIDNIGVIVINSSYHKDYTYGQVDIEELKDELEKIKDIKTKFIILHHHLIPIDIRNRSAVNNTYEIIKLCEIYNVKLILHGHQHMKIDLTIGKNNITILGVGSLLGDVGTNYSNEFNLINIDHETCNIYKYRFNEASTNNGVLGAFERY